MTPRIQVPIHEEFRTNPLLFARILWPEVTFYREQRIILQSVVDTPETFVPAAHQMGKDFTAGFVALWAFLCHHPVRVLTTTVADHHLAVLWGEIGRFIDNCKYPLDHRKGGPLVINHKHIRKIVNGVQCKISYLKGLVSEKGEGLAGHHAKYTFGIMDECSGVDEEAYRRISTWAKRILCIGNTYSTPGGAGFWEKAVKAGNIMA